jgi:hypothetical protein
MVILIGRWRSFLTAIRLRTFEDPSNVNAEFAVCPGEARTVADQPAGRGEFPYIVDCRNGVSRGECYDPIALAEEEGVGGAPKADLRLGACSKGTPPSRAQLQNLKVTPVSTSTARPSIVAGRNCHPLSAAVMLSFCSADARMT